MWAGAAAVMLAGAVHAYPTAPTAGKKASPQQQLVRHALSAADLAGLDGKVYWAPEVRKALRPVLKQVLGADWRTFDRAFDVAPPLSLIDGVVFGQGFWSVYSVALELGTDGSVEAALMDDRGCRAYGSERAAALCERLLDS
jgi:hypothetical protein